MHLMDNLDYLEAALQRLRSGQLNPQDLEQVLLFVQDTLLHQQAGPSEADTADELRTSDVLALLDAVAVISTYHQVEEILFSTAVQMVRLLDVEACAFSSWDREANTVTLWVEYTRPGWVMDSRWQQTFDLAAFPQSLQVLVRGEAIQGRIDRATLHHSEREFIKAEGIKTLLMMPLMAQDRTIGLVELMDRRTARTFSEREITVGKLLANHAAIVIERAILLKSAEQRAAELEAVRQASLSLTASLELPRVLDSILRTTMSLIQGTHNADIFLYDAGQLSFGAALFQDGPRDKPYASPRSDGLTYTVARRGEAIVVPNLRAHPLYRDAPSDWTGSIVGLPLKYGKRVVGVMNVANDQANAFTERELNTLRLLADQAAIAIENARLHNLVIQQARTDIVTGLYNRRALDRRLEEEVRRSNRYQRPFSLIMMDLDNFKQVNDTYGHPVGDQVLEQVGHCLSGVVRGSDFLARFGGDEFSLVMPETDLEAGENLAERLLAALIACPLHLPDAKEMTLSASVGIATYPQHATNSTTLLVAADQALYQAKKEGAGRIVSAAHLLSP